MTTLWYLTVIFVHFEEKSSGHNFRLAYVISTEWVYVYFYVYLYTYLYDDAIIYTLLFI